MSLSKKIPVNSPLHKVIVEGIRARVKAAKSSAGRSKFEEKWNEAERRAQAYLPERAADSIRRANRLGGKPEYTTIQIPYSYAVMLASHTYWTTVFLSRNPVVQMQGLHGEGENQVQAVEALQNYQTTVGEHLVPYHVWLYDVGKYGHSIIGAYWDKEMHYVSEITETANEFAGQAIGKKERIRTTRLVPGYEGNKLFNVRPLDFFHDPRVTVANMQKGEFCGYWTQVGGAKLLAGVDAGTHINVKQALAKAKSKGSRQEQGSEVVDLPDSGDFGTAYVSGGNATDSLGCYEFYIDLSPKQWGLGDSVQHEKWVFLVDDKCEIVLSAKPLGAFHNRFPFAVLEMEPEGYSMYNRGIPDVTEGIQNTVDWLINSHFYNVRKTLNNEFVVDPSRVQMRDLMNPLPGGLIRLKPAAFGSDTKTALTQLATQDVTRSHLTDLSLMMSLGERVTGVNDQIMGVANPSSRRSATEVRSSNTFSVNRMKTVSEYFSAMGFSPLSSMMVKNSQQYYDTEKKMRLAGSTAQLAGEQFIDVNPGVIAGGFDYVPVDGTLPVDRLAQANLWRTLLSEMRQIPPIMQQYDIAKIFGYVAQLTGLKNIEQFKIEVVPDGMAQQQAQQGNVIPLGGASGPKQGLGTGDGDTL